MKLKDAMQDTVTDTVFDPAALDRLTGSARVQGTRMRRRRHGVAALGVAVPVAAVIAGVAVLGAGDDGVRQGQDRESDTIAIAPKEPTVAPLTGRSTVAALQAAVDEVADGTFAGYGGQGGPVPGSKDTFGQLEFSPSDGSGVGVVGVNVQDAAILEGEPRTCLSFMEECQVRTLRNGDFLRTYADEAVPTPQGPGRRIVAELITTDGLRIVASATNGFDLPANKFDVTRPDPVLSTAQLTQVATQPWWNFQIAVRFDEAGRALAPYNDFDDEAQAQ